MAWAVPSPISSLGQAPHPMFSQQHYAETSGTSQLCDLGQGHRLEHLHGIHCCS